MTKRKVVCVYGKFDDIADFVLEPVCGDENCECCKDAFWIEDVKDAKELNKEKGVKNNG